MDFFFFFFFGHSTAYGVSSPGIRSELQLQQFRSLTHCARLELNLHPTPVMPPIPLCHSGDSNTNYNFIFFFFFQFHWDIIDIQHYVSLRYTAWLTYVVKWLSHYHSESIIVSLCTWCHQLMYTKEKCVFSSWWKLSGSSLLAVFRYTTQQC